MRTAIMHYNSKESIDKCSYDDYKYFEHNEENDDYIRMKRFYISALPEILTEKQLSVFMKFYAENKSAAEAAKEIGISTVTVYKHLRMAEKRLKKHCEMYILAITGKSYIKNLNDKFEQTLKRLPEEDAKIMRMYYIDGLQTSDIAKKEGCLLKSVRNIINSSKRKFSICGLNKLELNRIRRNAIENKIENKKKEGEA